MQTIIFKFIGGPMDGKTVAGEFGDQSEAERYYLLTDHGRIGQRFRTASPYAIGILAEEKLQVDHEHRFQRHYYEVADRLDLAGKVLVRAAYVSEAE